MVHSTILNRLNYDLTESRSTSLLPQIWRSSIESRTFTSNILRNLGFEVSKNFRVEAAGNRLKLKEINLPSILSRVLNSKYAFDLERISTFLDFGEQRKYEIQSDASNLQAFDSLQNVISSGSELRVHGLYDSGYTPPGASFTLVEQIPGKWGPQAQGTSATVTWSVMGAGLATLRSEFVNGDIISQDPNSVLPSGYMTEIRQAFDAWSAVAGINFVESIDPGSRYDAPNAASVDIRISVAPLDGLGRTIAVAGFPPNNISPGFAGDIQLDSAENWQIGSINGDTSTKSIFNVVAHEIGHAIGLNHASLPNALMWENYSEDFIGPQADDIAGAIAIYGPRARNDFNSDGQSDLLLYNPQQQLSSIGFMDGTGSITGSASLWTGWKPVAKGDFNNDGQTDIVIEHLANDWHNILYMNGPNIQSSKSIPGWTGWDIIGAGNFNDDGTDDILIKHPTQGWYGVWYMGGADGSEIQSSQGISMWSGWDVKGAGDFNGDGRAELIAQHQTQDWYGILELNSNQQIVSSQSIAGWAGWDIVGTSDQNEDGQADLLIKNRAQGWKGVWFMDGNQITGSQGLNIWQGWETIA